MAIDYSVYDDFLADANRDDRVGDHRAMVISVKHDTWASGDPRTKLVFQLLTANNAKADCTISEPPAPEVVKAEGKTWEKAKRMAIAGNIGTLKALAEHYGKTRDSVSEGDEFNVRTAKNKDGFVRVVAFLPKDAKPAAKAGSDVPF